MVVVITKFFNVFARDEILEIINSSGYKGEFSEVETEDGYIIGIHKIHSRIVNSTKYPVFAMHGFLTTPISFLLTDKKNSLPFILSDNGYDVFLGSRRGSKFSTKHRYLSTESKEFWNFDWHEIGNYDLATMIDFILESSNKSKCYFVGYSQGTYFYSKFAFFIDI